MNITKRYPTCDQCGDIFVFDREEPFAYCNCGTTEWGLVGRPADPIYSVVRESNLNDIFDGSDSEHD